MTINSIFTLIFLIVCVFLTFSALAQETEDVVYLKNGRIIRGTITEIILNDNIKIHTRAGNLLVFTMDEVEKIVKEPFLELEPSKPRTSPFYMFNPLAPNIASYTALLVGAHSSSGLDYPIVGMMGMYDSKTDSKWFSISSRQDLNYSLGTMGILEVSPQFFSDAQSFDLRGPIFVGSVLFCWGVEYSRVAYRLGAGASIASATLENFLDEVSVLPTAVASITVFPPKQDLPRYVESSGVTLYARWQGEGVMIGIALGLIQRGANW